MFLVYLICFASAFLISILFTLIVKKFAVRLRFFDIPDEQRKKHRGPIPLLGGIAIFLSFWIIAGYLLLCHPLYGVEILGKKLGGIFLASVVLIIMGAIDDARQLSVKTRLLITAATALIAVLGGVGLEKITNPFGGIMQLNFWPIHLGFLGAFFVVADVLVFCWLLAMMYATKILDGLDGLATGIAAIGSLMIFFLATTHKYFQPNVGLLSIIFAGSCLGFLVFNFYPAKIFLGEGGSLFVGFILGVLAIISGGKVATALLVMAIPILDLIRVAYIRIQRKQSIFKGDREHLHFRLLDLGFSHRRAVLLLYFIACFFGVTTLFLQSSQKFFALIFLALLMAGISFWAARKGDIG